MNTITERYTIPAGPNCMAVGQKNCKQVFEDDWDCHTDYYCTLTGKIKETKNDAYESTYLGKGEHNADNSQWWLPKCARCKELCPNGGTVTVTTTVTIQEKP